MMSLYRKDTHTKKQFHETKAAGKGKEWNGNTQRLSSFWLHPRRMRNVRGIKVFIDANLFHKKKHTRVGVKHL